MQVRKKYFFTNTAYPGFFQVPVVLLLIVVVLNDIFRWFPDAEPEVLDVPRPPEGREAYEMQNQEPIGEGGIAPSTTDPQDRPDVTQEQIMLVTLFTATMLFIYDGLQVGLFETPNSN